MTDSAATPDCDTDLAAAWRTAWLRLGVAAADMTLCRRVLACYAEPHRHYHGMQHLRECLRLHGTLADLARHPGEVEIALWFHDAIYDPQRRDNEILSADWARQAVMQSAGDAARADRVQALVLATRHDAQVGSDDAALLVDIDLAILGAPAVRFDEYEMQVRREYAFVPDTVFRAKRRALLQGFLGRANIYTTERCRALYEAPARDNLRRSIARLAQPG